jgi:hypothetical protein
MARSISPNGSPLSRAQDEPFYPKFRRITTFFVHVAAATGCKAMAAG